MVPALFLTLPAAVALAAAPVQSRAPATPSVAPIPILPIPASPAPTSVQDAEQAADAPADVLGFTDRGLRMTVPVMIGRDGPYQFIVDTGAERTVVAREVAAALGLAPGKHVRISAMAGPAPAATFLLPSIDVGVTSAAGGARLQGRSIEAPALLANDLGAQGLVGIDTLQGRAVTIDFATRTMAVVPATKRLRRERFGPDDIVIHARNRFGQLVVTDATYKGHKVRVVMDTGAVVSMGNRAFERLVAGNVEELAPMELLSVTGVKVEANFGLVPQFRIGDTGFANLPVAFLDAPPFVRLGLSDRPAVFLGMDALRLFGQVRIDFANHEVRFARPKTTPP